MTQLLHENLERLVKPLSCMYIAVNHLEKRGVAGYSALDTQCLPFFSSGPARSCASNLVSASGLHMLLQQASATALLPSLLKRFPWEASEKQQRVVKALARRALSPTGVRALDHAHHVASLVDSGSACRMQLAWEAGDTVDVDIALASGRSRWTESILLISRAMVTALRRS